MMISMRFISRAFNAPKREAIFLSLFQVVSIISDIKYDFRFTSNITEFTDIC